MCVVVGRRVIAPARVTSGRRCTPAARASLHAGGPPHAWVATRDPDPELLARGGDPGIIARFEISIE